MKSDVKRILENKYKTKMNEMTSIAVLSRITLINVHKICDGNITKKLVYEKQIPKILYLWQLTLFLYIADEKTINS